MTRKDYVLLAEAFRQSRPDNRLSSPEDAEDEVHNAARRAAYDTWVDIILAVSNALQEDNPAFDRMRFQYAATKPR
jgi:hypothetical protein